ncbi:MAG: DUF11 domain-containing protein [Gaiellaceae bacterium]
MSRSSSPRASVRNARLRCAALVALVGAVALIPAIDAPPGAAHAADANQFIQAPPVGSTVTKPFSGTVTGVANPTSNCDGDATADVHRFTVYAPGGYATRDTSYTFTITWTPRTGEASAHDLILTVLGPDPNPSNNVPEGPEVGSSDGGSPAEQVSAMNLASGKQYNVLACAFANVPPQPYNGKLVATSVAKAVEVDLPAADSKGLIFSAGVPADNQRDEAEPLIDIDPAGNMYTCGPTGFSNAAEYAQVSTDGGDQFHLLGTPPRGQLAPGGGGDCAIATGIDKNGRGQYQLAYTGLGPLTGFATSTSPNSGHLLGTAGPNGNGLPGGTTQGVLADRQWEVFIDPAKNPAACTNVLAPPVPGSAEGCVLLSYNQQVPRNVVVQRSANGGLTYNPLAARAAANPRFPGPLRYHRPSNTVYFSWDRINAQGQDEIRLSVSKDGGLTWTNCLAAIAQGETPPFTIADHDSAGNIYIVYSEKAKYHTYMVALHAADVAKCNLPVANIGKTNPGFSAPVQVDRGNIRTTVFPWIVGGAPGRVAVTFYGTTTDGSPNVGCRPSNPPGAQGFCAAWHVYVNQSLNAISPDATFSQVRATTHPFHYDSICLVGLACDLSIPPGDRTLADFFSIDYNAVSKKLAVVYNRAEKKPNEDFGHVANPMVLTQIGGPSLGGVWLGWDQNRTPVRKTAAPEVGGEPNGDALSTYSVMTPGPPPPVNNTGTNEPAMDFLEASVGPQRDLNTNQLVSNGGFTVTMKLADLSTTQLTQSMTRTGSQSLLWVFRFVNGYQAAAASARWSPTGGFTFGYNDYTTGVSPCVGVGSLVTNDKCVLYPGGMTIPGKADQATGTIRLSVPRSVLRALTQTPDAFGRPEEIAAPLQDYARFYDATAFSLGNTVSPTQSLQSFLYPLDSTRAFDFVIFMGGALPGDPTVVLTKTGPLTAARGSNITYRLAYRNLGPNPSANAKIVDTLPAQVQFVSATNGGTYAPATRKVTWNLGTVPFNGSGTVSVTVSVPPTTPNGTVLLNQADFTGDLTVSPKTAAWLTTVASG